MTPRIEGGGAVGYLETVNHPPVDPRSVCWAAWRLRPC
jgi:hypothetical protein